MRTPAKTQGCCVRVCDSPGLRVDFRLERCDALRRLQEGSLLAGHVSVVAATMGVGVSSARARDEIGRAQAIHPVARSGPSDLA